MTDHSLLPALEMTRPLSEWRTSWEIKHWEKRRNNCIFCIWDFV